jgi:hypothetical protein
MEKISDWWCRTFHAHCGRGSAIGICWLCGRSSFNDKEKREEVKQMVYQAQSMVN